MTEREIKMKAALKALECEKSALETELKLLVHDQMRETGAAQEVQVERQASITTLQNDLLDLQKRFEAI